MQEEDGLEGILRQRKQGAARWMHYLIAFHMQLDSNALTLP